MQEVCSSCYHRISTAMMLNKPPKSFMQRLEQQQPTQPRMPPAAALDPETRALEERLQKLRESFPATAARTTSDTPDDLLRQMNDELFIEKTEHSALAQRLRILHETMPAATPDTVVLPSSTKQAKDDDDGDDDKEFPWCTVCNENAKKRCLDCDELFCEPCAKKIHRQSGYKDHELEAYKPSAKARKKYNY